MNRLAAESCSVLFGLSEAYSTPFILGRGTNGLGF
jgi:hypothetical protein